jgi:hypothetical protein
MEEAIEHLQRALTYTHQRQMFFQIQAGSYVLRATPRPLHQWALEITQRYNVEVIVASECVMMLDWEVVELVFHDAFTNAKKYGYPDKKLWIQLSVHNDQNTLLINVCNVVACPGAPDITIEMAAAILKGGKGALSDAGLVGNEAGAQNDAIRTSDCIGILNARKSVMALGGELHMYQELIGNESVTTMQIQAPFRRPFAADRRNASSVSSTPLHSADSEFIPDPKKLNPAMLPSDIDGPTLQLRTLPSVMTSPAIESHQESTAAGPKCFSLDDAPSLLRQYNRMLHKYLQAGDSLVAGTNRAEVEAAVNIAMGRTMYYAVAGACRHGGACRYRHARLRPGASPACGD